MHLDTVCTMVDVDAVVMYPNVADELAAIGLTAGEGARYRSPSRRRSSSRRPRPWASTTLRIIDTGLDPVTAEREQWDDGNNTLAIGPRLAVAYERNVETNARLEDAGIELIRISGSERGSGRGDRDACPARSAVTRIDRRCPECDDSPERTSLDNFHVLTQAR
jgi:arginine deiminase